MTDLLAHVPSEVKNLIRAYVDANSPVVTPAPPPVFDKNQPIKRPTLAVDTYSAEQNIATCCSIAGIESYLQHMIAAWIKHPCNHTALTTADPFDGMRRFNSPCFWCRDGK